MRLPFRHPNPRAPRHSRLSTFGCLLVGLAVFVAGVTGTTVVAERARSRGASAVDRRFEEAAVEIEAATRAELTRYQDVAQAASGIFSVDPQIDALQFRSYVDALDLESRYPEALAIAFATPGEMGAASSATLRLLEPVSVCPTCIGLQAGALPVVAATFAESARTREPRLSAVLDVSPFEGFDVEEANAQRIVMLVVPVQRPAPGEGDLLPPVGWVFVVLNGARLPEAVLARANVSEIGVALVDLGNDGREEVLGSTSADAVTGRSWRGTIEIYGQRWAIDVDALAGFDSGAYEREAEVVILGLVLSVLAAFVVASLLLARQRALAHAIAIGNREDRLRRMFDSSPVAMIELAPDSGVRRWNPTASRLLGWPPWEEGAPSPSPSLPFETVAALAEGVEQEADHRFERSDGVALELVLSASPLRGDDGRLLGTIAMANDITERARLMAELEHLAGHDLLTGLPNRGRFLERVEEALARARRQGTQVVVLYCDLDRFKAVNDTLGHRLGDVLLAEAADRLRGVLRETDTLARMGGDEFVVCSEQLEEGEGVAVLAQRLREVLDQPFDLDGRSVSVGLSIGVAVGDGRDMAEDLLRRADVALYWAKERGRNRVEVFEAGLENAVAHRVIIQSTIGDALPENQLCLHYQPQVDLVTGDVVAVEALLRWDHPELGQLRPREFLWAAEDTVLLDKIGLWVVGEACRWRASLGPGQPLQVAVNVAVGQLLAPAFVDQVAELLAGAAAEPEWLCLEVAEASLVDPTPVRHSIERLRGLGVTVALDDLGTGAATLASLRDLPLDQVKLDGSLLLGVTADQVDALIVTSLVRLAHDLGLLVVAEGVEDPDQLSAVRAMGVDRAQGYLFGHPAPADQVRLDAPTSTR